MDPALPVRQNGGIFGEHDAKTIAQLELVHNHHNFAWREEHEGESVIVRRKGAPPAFHGQKRDVTYGSGREAELEDWQGAQAGSGLGEPVVSYRPPHGNRAFIVSSDSPHDSPGRCGYDRAGMTLEAPMRGLPCT
jgi:hypothetical protein